MSFFGAAGILVGSEVGSGEGAEVGLPVLGFDEGGRTIACSVPFVVVFGEVAPPGALAACRLFVGFGVASAVGNHVGHSVGLYVGETLGGDGGDCLTSCCFFALENFLNRSFLASAPSAWVVGGSGSDASSSLLPLHMMEHHRESDRLSFSPFHLLFL